MQAAFQALLRIRAVPKAPHVARLVSNKAYFGKMPALKEADLEETYVRGSGPGGQSINKSKLPCITTERADRLQPISAFR